jgi:hypothetical protein
MSAIKIVQSAFVAGEVSPNVYGRVDRDFYFKALQKARNVYVTPQGGVRRREGMGMVAETPSSVQVRLVEFSFGDPGTGPQDYLLEFSPQRMRVFKADVLVADFDSGDDADLTVLTAPVIAAMDYTQSADTLLLTHKSIQPLKITRTSDTAWTFEPTTLENIPTFAFSGPTVTNPAQTLTPSATTGEITLTAGGGSVFVAGDVGQYVVVNRGLVRITEYTSITVVKGLVVSDLSSVTAAASGAWDLERGYEAVWSNTRGWPAAVTFFRGRLYFAGGSRPQTVWGSKVGDFFDFDQGSGLDADALEFTLDDDGVNAIHHMFPGRTLQIFTKGGEFFVRSSTTKPITPNNIVDLVERATRHGSESIRPVEVEGVTIFVELGGAVVRDWVYDDSQQSYTSQAISDFADHLIRSPVDMVVRRSKTGMAWDNVFIPNADGTIAVLNIKRAQEFQAWSLFDTQGLVEQMKVVGKTVYLVVVRDIDGTDKRFIEVFDPDLKLDCSLLKTSVTATTSWTGFGHLNGQDVWVFGDGYVLENETPASGNITSSEDVFKLEAGLFFAASIQPLNPDANVGGRTLTGDKKRIAYVNLLLKDCRELIVKMGTKQYEPPFREFGDHVLDEPVQTYTGWKKVFVRGMGRSVAPEITQVQPVEFEILSMTIGVV